MFLVLGQSIACLQGRQKCEDVPHCYEPECCDPGAPGLQNISGSQREGYGWVSKHSSLLSYLVSYYSYSEFSEKAIKSETPENPRTSGSSPTALTCWTCRPHSFERNTESSPGTHPSTWARWTPQVSGWSGSGPLLCIGSSTAPSQAERRWGRGHGKRPGGRNQKWSFPPLPCACPVSTPTEMSKIQSRLSPSDLFLQIPSLLPLQAAHRSLQLRSSSSRQWTEPGAPQSPGRPCWRTGWSCTAAQCPGYWGFYSSCPCGIELVPLSEAHTRNQIGREQCMYLIGSSKKEASFQRLQPSLPLPAPQSTALLWAHSIVFLGYHNSFLSALLACVSSL